MTIFSQQISSDDLIAVQPDRLWAILNDTDALADLTPLVARIHAQADGRWRWQLSGVHALGISAAPTFTTIMEGQAGRLAFSPDPQADERATATGVLSVEPAQPGWSHIAISLVATVDLPLPAFAARAVEKVMFSTMKAGGSRFADNLLLRLGSPDHRGLNVRQGNAAVLTR